MLLLWFMLKNNSKTKKTQNILFFCDSPNNTEQKGTSHKSTSQSEISGFSVFSSPISNTNMLPGTSIKIHLQCIRHLTANIFNFCWNTELDIFLTLVMKTKLDMKATEQQQLASSVSISLVKAESNHTAQQPRFSTGSQAPWTRCVLQKGTFWYLLQPFNQYEFYLSVCL